MTNPPNKTYSGNCHCGAVKYSVSHSSLEDGHEVSNCDCSICTRNGYLFIYPAKADVHFSQGEDSLQSYTFGDANVTHLFCPRCGTSVGADFPGAGGIFCLNVRTFKDIDLDALKLKKCHMKDRPPLHSV